jgi:hypothetical protein
MSDNLQDSEESMLPATTKNGWLYIYLVVATLAITAVILGQLYRDVTKPGEVISRDRRKYASNVVYTIVYGQIQSQRADSIINIISNDIGKDSLRTDMIIGSPTTDPWCASISEYRRNLKKAMSTPKIIPLGKQSVIASMIGGLLTKNDLPARLYLVGNLTGNDASMILGRTESTAAALELRSRIMGAVEVINFMDTTRPANKAYVDVFKSKKLVRD